MHNHASFCLSGDNTISATIEAIKLVARQEDVDDRFVIVLSDANLSQYNISPKQICDALDTSDKVNAFIIFIGSLEDQAEKLIRGVGTTRAFSCLSTKDLPKIFKRILQRAVEQ
jgi:Cu/Ag efflux pump CusA